MNHKLASNQNISINNHLNKVCPTVQLQRIKKNHVNCSIHLTLQLTRLSFLVLESVELIG